MFPRERRHRQRLAADTLNIPVLKMRSPRTFIRSLSDNRASAPLVRATEAALLLFTSATTGSPKLVPLTQANLHALAGRDIKVLPLSATDRFLSLMPLFHMQGLSAALAQLLCGGTVISTLGIQPHDFSGVARAIPAYLVHLQPSAEPVDSRDGAPASGSFPARATAFYSYGGCVAPTRSGHIA